MIPSLGEKYDIEIEITSKTRQEYGTNEYLAKNLPAAQAITRKITGVKSRHLTL